MLKKAFNATNRMCFLYHEKAELEELGKTYFQCSRIVLMGNTVLLTPILTVLLRTSTKMSN